MSRLSNALDREILEFNRQSPTKDAAYWKAMWTMEMNECRKLRAALVKARGES